MNPLEFEYSLTKGDYTSPIIRHIVFQYSILYHAGVRGDAMAAAEHSLREMFAYTAQYRGPYEALRPERLDADWAKRLGDGIAQAAKTLRETMQRQRLARQAALTPEQRDQRSVRRYERAVAEERARGLDYVRAQGRRVRKEVGLR